MVMLVRAATDSPEGEDDAVTITASDLEGLQPMRFLSNNIIDFYIM
jgi:Ulp1 family protease